MFESKRRKVENMARKKSHFLIAVALLLSIFPGSAQETVVKVVP